MTTVARDVSKISNRYRTTIPSGVRKQLNLKKGDRIRCCNESNGRIHIELFPAEGGDSATGAFLDLVEADIRAHSERLHTLDGALHDHLGAPVGDVEVDLDEPLSLDAE